ncbi:MAG: FAD-dependent oxidoreductase [Peptococcaceae bacterium]|nr:FAD-dependent oxidoreductase [Peptococcaceae bacterium]
MKKVTVLGGGIAGIEAAIMLRQKGFAVTLISPRNYLYIYPISIWIPTGEKSFAQTSMPLGQLAKKHQFKLVIDEVVSIRASEQTVELKAGGSYSDFDYLVLAIGAGKLKPKGAENTLSICGEPEQSLQIKARLDELVQRGSGNIAVGFGGNPKDSSAVRGGPGFEFIFNVHNMLQKRNIRDKFTLTFFAPMVSPGARMGEKAVRSMDIMFGKLNINTHFGIKIKQFESGGVRFEDDSLLAADFTMFIAAGDGHSVIKASDLPQNEAGFIKIDPYCQVVGYENIYAVGDCAALEGPDWKAKQGHVGEVMARNVADNLANKEQGIPERKSYIEHLSILCVMDSGNGAAYVHRDNSMERILMLPVVGHWLKKSWGTYYKLSKMGRIPRLPNM